MIKNYFFGFSIWKRKHILAFFPKSEKYIFANSLSNALKHGLNTHDTNIYIWGKKDFPKVEEYAKSHNISLFRVEDGFVRSVSLGSDLTKAYSLVIDSRGIYFDPHTPSDLENILQTYTFDNVMLNRSKQLQEYLIENKISKYNIDKNKTIVLQKRQENQTVILVPGQVEDDASIIYGANGMTNSELLKEVRKIAPNAYIIYKPHPDVHAGNRVGHIQEHEATQYCDIVIDSVSLDSVVTLADEIHTMTSLVGFEALIRGKKVYTYGLPFYAGWGLTTDVKVCQRRSRKLTLDMLVAAALILYPRYINPKTNGLCEIEEISYEIDKEKNRYNTDTLYRLRIQSRNWISRKIQLLIKVIFSE